LIVSQNIVQGASVYGFIPELNANQRKQVAQLLTYWKENREQASIFAVEEDYEAIVIEFI